MRIAIRTTLAGAALALVATRGGTAAHAKPIGPNDPGSHPRIVCIQVTKTVKVCKPTV